MYNSPLKLLLVRLYRHESRCKPCHTVGYQLSLMSDVCVCVEHVVVCCCLINCNWVLRSYWFLIWWLSWD